MERVYIRAVVVLVHLLGLSLELLGRSKVFRSRLESGTSGDFLLLKSLTTTLHVGTETLR